MGGRRRGRGPRRRGRWALVPLPVLLAAAVAVAVPRAALRLARPVAVRAGAVSPRWSGRGAFVHPGADVPAPAAGRLAAAAPGGIAAAGTVLAEIAPAPTVRGLLPLWARWAGVPAAGVPAAVRLRGALCLRSRCGSPAPAPRAAAARAVRAAAAGWWSPGADPLAALDPAALSDVPPQAVRAPVVRLRRGAAVAAGESLGEMGAPWLGLWLVVLPESALPELRAAASGAISWPGGGPPVPATFQAAGPEVDGRFVAVLASGATGAPPGPPARAEVTLGLPPVSGLVVPAAALRAGPSVLAAPRGDAGPAAFRRVPVRILARGPGGVVVSGLPAGARVLARPGWLPAWLAGTGGRAGESHARAAGG